MRLIRSDNTISSFGLMFVFCGLIFPGNAFSVEPPGCLSIEEIGEKEAQWQSKMFSYNPANQDYVDCYKFTVGSSPDLTQLTVSLRYEVTGDDNDDLILKLFDSRSTEIIKQTTIGAGDYNGSQGTETLFLDTLQGEELHRGEIYYIRIDNDQTAPVDDQYPYEIRWNDNDDANPPPEIIDPNPGHEQEVQPGEVSQLLQVQVENTATCHIYYKDENDSGFTDSGPLVPYEDGGVSYCKATVAYDNHMNNNGTNYWYVEAVNAEDTTRYPSTAGTTLSFTVKPPPEISTPSPTDGDSVTAGASGQLLQVVVTNADSCTIYYGTDENNISAFEAGTLAEDLCKVTVLYDGVHMINNGMNYWYVEAVNAVGSTFYRSTDPLSFTASITQDKKPIIAPMLLLLLKGDSEEPPSTTSGKAMPWLMLLL
ncbi:MAG: hypothetical protein D3903_01900 [Candidatus Electrothrix sp. GM3_4]|nr:hypothetical protein [Candidatus Electrothrix sp. GM3_4]